jgi:cyclic pyranopterin phosphate synthase
MSFDYPEPLDLRISVTESCSLRCIYCVPGMRRGMVPQRMLTNSEIVDFVSLMIREYGVRKVRLTGGEPLLRPDILELVRALSRLDISDLGMTTNGQQLEDMARPLRQAGLHRVNVSLDSIDAANFQRITGGDLQQTLRGLDAAATAGLSPVKVNTVVLRGMNDQEINPLARFCLRHGYWIRFLELMPIGTSARPWKELYFSASDICETLNMEFKMKFLGRDQGECSQDYKAVGRHGENGRIGVISSCSAPFCDGCRRLRLTARGILIGYLSRHIGIPVYRLLQSHDDSRDECLKCAVLQALNMKENVPEFNQPRLMATMGG